MGVTLTLVAAAVAIIAFAGAFIGIKCYRKFDQALIQLGAGRGLD
jgi:hypothetical protein